MTEADDEWFFDNTTAGPGPGPVHGSSVTEADTKTVTPNDGKPPPFTAEDARGMVQAAMAPGSRLKLPSKEALDQLAMHLSVTREWAAEREFGAGAFIRVLSDAAPLKAAEELAAAIGPWRKALALYLTFTTKTSGEIGEYPAFASLDALSAALASALPHLQPAPAWESLPDGWHRIAHFAERLFRTAMRSTNPSVKFGVTNDGPIARFVSITVTSIYGIEVSSGTVAQYLKRRAMPGKRVFLPVPPAIIGLEVHRYMRRHIFNSGKDCMCVLCVAARQVEQARDKS